MESGKIDSFSARLNSELSVLSWKDRSELLVRIGRMELRMRSDGQGQERPIWKGPLFEDRLLGADVVVPTECGDVRGRVICFGLVNMGAEYERSVVVHVPASGTQYEVPGSSVRLASPEESGRIVNEVQMAVRLAEAVAEHGSASIPIPERSRKRGQKEPGLQEWMLATARTHVNVALLEEGSVSHKLTGVDPAKKLYVFKGQLRVDVSGFSFEHPGLRRITDEEARAMHLGRVRGQLLFDDRMQTTAAFEAALEGMR
jgi:hypothetical protein